MNKKELKQLIKPIIKECVREALIEEGLLSEVVAEVTKGVTSGMMLSENKAPQPQEIKFEEEKRRPSQKSETVSKKVNTYRKKLMDSIGKEAYNGVNLFEGTTPLNSAGHRGDGTPAPGNILGEDPTDSGVPLTGPLSEASKLWSKLI